MSEKIEISSNRSIGNNELPFIIAEIGNNHNGDAVKFQVKDIETSFSKELLDKPYDVPNSFGKTYREHKMALEFSKEQLKQLYDYADELGIIFFSTPFESK